ncbi:lipocalin-like domain-containing protein [Chloroflexota bacterium]
MAQNHFLGTWRLVSLENESANGQISYPWGHNITGYLTYNEDGYMFVALMSVNRGDFASEGLKRANAEDEATALDYHRSYCGRYEVKGDTVIHHAEISSFSDWIGVDLERIFNFDGNRLTLSTPPVLIKGTQQTTHLIWERV